MYRYATVTLAGLGVVIALMAYATASPASAQARHVQGLIDAAHARAIAHTGTADLQFSYLAQVLREDDQPWQLDHDQQHAYLLTQNGCVRLSLVDIDGYVTADVTVTGDTCP